MLCYIVYLRSAVSAGRQDVQDEIYGRVADKVSAVRSVFKEQCAGAAGVQLRSWQTLAQQKVASARDEKLGQVKVNPGVGMLQCCQVFALHCSFLHSFSLSLFVRFCHFFHIFAVFAHESAVRAFESENPKAKTKTQTPTRSRTRNRKSEVLHSICEQAANHQSPSPARIGDRQQRHRQRQHRLQLQSCSSEMRNSLFI